MADEGRMVRDFGIERQLATATIAPYEVQQTPTGKAGVHDNATAVASGSYYDLTTVGQATLVKATGFVALKGGRAYWDHSANNVSYKKANDRDYYLGRFAEDSSNTSLSCVVDLNADPPYDLDIARDTFDTVLTGTQSLTTGGFNLLRRGGSHNINISATNEAQKADMLSRAGFATGANAIIRIVFNVVSDGAGTVVDVSLGVANATHATDADSITDSIFVHLNANDVNIYLESDDGTTEVAATDSTIDYTAGTSVEVWIDMRNPADVQIYINGVLALDGTTFNVNASVATWKLLAHIEKTASTDTYELDVESMQAWFAEN